jgi:hypothetical protein
VIHHHGGSFVLGGIDDRIMGKPNWEQVLAKHGPPHLLMAHNPITSTKPKRAAWR